MTRLLSVGIGSALAVACGTVLMSGATARTRIHVTGQSWSAVPPTGVPRNTHPKGFSRHGGTFSPPGLSRRSNGIGRHHAPSHSRHSRSRNTRRGLQVLPRLDGGLDRRRGRGQGRIPPGHRKRN